MRDHDSDQAGVERAGDPLEALVFEYLERSESGEAPLEELCRRHPALAGALRQRVQALIGAGLVARPDGDEPEPIPETLGEFRLLQRLGAGAMGVVYLAEQTSLGRRVALKLIRPEQLYFPGARRRFRREVEVVARLAHPNIVPVHSVGEERGVPYFAMELVVGPSLAEVILELAGRDPATLTGADLAAALERLAARHPAADGKPEAGSGPAFAGGWVEACLRIVRQAAEALEHAHRRGVLHRDVKPSNVLVTPAGRAQLLDFGLAASRSTERVTRTGSQVGSLLYMAPEVLRGATDELDVRADVYSLGVTLLELLSLSAPFEARGPEQLALDIASGRARSPRAANPAVRLELEIVCRKAIDPDPDRRYSSAEAFARDLTNLLEHRPIEARRASPLLRARRWSQRHPGGAVSFALGAVLLLGGPLGYALQQRSARIVLAAEQRLTEEQRLRAEASLARAMDALELLTRVGDGELRGIPQASEARRQLLEGALRFYEQLAGREPGESQLEQRVAHATWRAGELLLQLGRLDEAQVSLQRALERFEQLEGEHERDGRRGAVRCLRGLTLVQLSRGDFDAARSTAEAALALGRELAALPDADAQDRAVLVAALDNRGNVEVEIVDSVGALDAVRALREARDRLEALAAEGQPSFELRLHLASVWNRLGLALVPAGDAEESRAALERAAELLEELYAEDPRDPTVRDILVIARSNLSKGVPRAERADELEQLEQLERAVELARGLVEDFPLLPGYRRTLVGVSLNLGAMYSLLRRDHEALAVFEAVLPDARRLYGEHPDVVEYGAFLVAVEANLGGMLLEEDRTQLALAHLERARELAGELLRSHPSHTTLRDAWIGSQVNLAKALRDLGRHQDAFELACGFETDDPRAQHHALEVLLECVALARSDAELASEEREDLAWEYASRTVERIRLGSPIDAEELERLETSADFAPLRGHPEFEELLTELRARLGPPR